MSTARLLWGCMWRATVYGVGLGAGLGAIYGALAVPLFAAVLKLIEEEGWERLTGAASFFAGTTLSYGPPLGFLAGMLVVGPLMGLLLGSINGLSLFVVLKAFPPGRRARLFLSWRALAWVACLATVAVAVAITSWYVLYTDPQFISRLHLQDRPTSRGLKPEDFANFTVIVLGTALIAVVAMRRADGKVVDWYASEAWGAEREDQAPADSERPETS